MFEFSKYINLARSNISRKFSEFGNEFEYNNFIIKRNIN